jgi:hypothetical protein
MLFSLIVISFCSIYKVLVVAIVNETWQVHLVSNTPGVLPGAPQVLPGALDIMPRLPGMVVNTA